MPPIAFYKLYQIIGKPKAVPPVPALIPIGRTTFLNGVKAGKFPKPIKLGARSVAWKVEDIRALVESLGGD
jgi:predicted DNA-binding transcriptional regulator AlpA